MRVLSLVLLPVLVREQAAALRRAMTPDHVLASLLFAWSLFYLVFTIPKLGPARDFDMFFISYLCMSFLVGMVVESWSPRHRAVLLGAWVASSVLSLVYVVGWAPSA